MVNELCTDPEKPWATYKRGNSIDQRQVARILSEFAVTSTTIRINGKILKGYEKKQFDEIFARYLPNLAVTPLQTNITNDLEAKVYPLQSVTENLSVTLNTAISNGCNSVTAKYPENTLSHENVEHGTDNSYFEDTYSSVNYCAGYESRFDEVDYSENDDIDYGHINYNPNPDEIDDYLLEERAAIIEFDGGLTREEAEMAVWGRSSE